jgi:hypothetical protein
VKIDTWEQFNRQLMQTEDPEEVQRLIVEERNGRGRLEFILRAFTRFNRLRREHEIREIVAGRLPW